MKEAYNCIFIVILHYNMHHFFLAQSVLPARLAPTALAAVHVTQQTQCPVATSMELAPVTHSGKARTATQISMNVPPLAAH